MNRIHLITTCLLCCGLVAAVLTACTQKPASSSYTITGTAEGLQDGDTVKLCDMAGVVYNASLESAVIKDGKFTFQGQVESPVFRILVAMRGGQPVGAAALILENADIQATIKQEGTESVVEGGPNQKLLNEWTAGWTKFNNQMEQPNAVMHDPSASETARQAARQTLDSLAMLLKAFDKKSIIDNIPSAFSDILFSQTHFEFSETEKDEILKVFGEKQPESPAYKSFMEQRKAQEPTAVGAQYTDIEMPAPDGSLLRVSDFVAKNKYTLIDFWASWCGPCRAEMPTVVKAYEDYHQKGLEVVGVSLDDDHDAWVKAIGQLRMPWPQMSDLKGWECAGAKLYNVRSIPANVLVDQQGRIVAKDLRGTDLLEKLAEMMK